MLGIWRAKKLISQQSIFKTQLSPYDILIHLRPALLPRYAQAVEPETDVWESRTKYRNVGMAESVYGSDVKIGFDPAAAFARDIQVSRLRSSGAFQINSDQSRTNEMVY